MAESSKSKPSKRKSKSKKPRKRGIYSNDDPTQLFTFEQQLGTGSYGGVVRARDLRDNSTVAIKIVGIETDNTKELIREIQILSKCRSKYIVNYFGSYRHSDEIWITMEYCAAGSVGDILKITKKTLSELQISIITKHVLSGLKYLHAHNIIHRDIKCGNVLLSSNGQCKLSDFAVSAQLAQTISRRNTVIGSPFWMAPEVLKENNYNEKADIWSLGITVIEMAHGKPPLSHLHPLRALLTIPSNPSPTLNPTSDFSQDLHEFLARFLQKNPQKRLTASELLKHKFIKNAPKKSTIQQLIVNIMPKIEKYREKKNKGKKLKKKKKKKKKKKIIYNAEPVTDDEVVHHYKPQQPQEENMLDVNENENNDAQNGNYDDMTMIRREKPAQFDENDEVDVRAPEYIISMLFTDNCESCKEFDLGEYICENASVEELEEVRKALLTAYWKDKQILEDYYIDCRTQIKELLEKMKLEKSKRKKKRSGKKYGKYDK